MGRVVDMGPRLTTYFILMLMVSRTSFCATPLKDPERRATAAVLGILICVDAYLLHGHAHHSLRRAPVIFRTDSGLSPDMLPAVLAVAVRHDAHRVRPVPPAPAHPNHAKTKSPAFPTHWRTK